MDALHRRLNPRAATSVRTTLLGGGYPHCCGGRSRRGLDFVIFAGSEGFFRKQLDRLKLLQQVLV
jgi:hypothetical protein